jgi:hypothetical protein
VTIKNIGNYDIFIGPAGLLQPHLWFNAQAKGIVTQSYPGVVYDRIANVMVLRPKATASQVIRLDQGELGEALLQRPNGSIIVSGTVLTNPMTLSGGVAIGPGGFAVQFTRNYVRPPSDLHSASSRKKLDEKLASGDPHEKMQALELLAAYVRVLGKEMDATARASANDYLAGIAKARIDSVPEVAAWAQYLVASLPGVEGREQMLRAMVGSTDWQTRLLGVAAVRAQNAELQQQLAAGVAESDPDPVIKRLAAAIIAQLKQSTTQPASNAATAPTAGPATSPSQGPALQPQ